MISLRRALGGLAVAGLCGGELTSAPPAGLPIDSLNLSPDQLAELEKDREAISTFSDAKALADLPLDGIEPAFTFVPR